MIDQSKLTRPVRWLMSGLVIAGVFALVAATVAGGGVFLFAGGWARAFGLAMFAGGVAAMFGLLTVLAAGMASAPNARQARRGWRIVACGAITVAISAVCLVHVLLQSGV